MNQVLGLYHSPKYSLDKDSKQKMVGEKQRFQKYVWTKC